MQRNLPPVPQRNAIRGDRIRRPSPDRAPDGARSRARAIFESLNDDARDAFVQLEGLG
jgi:hypothetical protein